MLCNTKCNTKKKEPYKYRTLRERETGIEPATPTLARLYSTTEPLAHKLKTKYELFVKAL